jgi:hypothetical protein
MNTLALNLSAANSGTVPSVASRTATANLVAAIVRTVLSNAQSLPQQSAQGSSETKPEDVLAKLGSILTPLLNPSLIPKNGTALMDINLEQLVNNSSLQNLIRQLPPELLSRPQVFEVLVLQSILLPNASTQEKTPAALPLLIVPQPANPNPTAITSPTLYRITVEWQNRLLQIVSPQPFPAGNRLQLQTNTHGEITLLANNAAAVTTNTVLAATTPTATNPPIPVQAPLPTPLQTLQQSVRELLPRQQPLHTLVPLLQKFVQPATLAQLPQPIAKAVMQLLRSVPRAEQAQAPSTLRQAVVNSGSFLEGRIAREQSNAPTQPAALAPILTTDIKAQINALLAAIRIAAPNVSPNAPAVARAQPQQTVVDEFVYTHKPTAHNATPNPQIESDSEADSLLTQLGKLLQSGLARIQLNQLDSATARHVGSEAQPPIPTWVVEVPLRTAYGADQLHLRIEQRQRKQQNRTRQQWTVDIALDLHAAGKLAATLTVVEKSVAATLWAEHAETHRAVRAEMDYLRADLESVGVNVTEMHCRHGVPPTRSTPLTQRLVDVHT